MLKALLFTCLFIFNITACATSSEVNHSVDKNTSNKEYRTGSITQTELKTYKDFFHHHKTATAPADVELLKAIDKPIVITTYFGLWCHDSKREVPLLLDLLQQANNKNIVHRLIALDLDKSEPFGRQKKEQVKFTPTIIVKVENKEVGRIVEKPKISLAQDIVNFLNN